MTLTSNDGFVNFESCLATVDDAGRWHLPKPRKYFSKLTTSNYVKLISSLVKGLLLQPLPTPLPLPPKKRFRLRFVPVRDRSIFTTVEGLRRIFFATTEHLLDLPLKIYSFSLISPYCQWKMSWPQTDKLNFYNSAIMQNTNCSKDGGFK